jgi:hypothetical protein
MAVPDSCIHMTSPPTLTIIAMPKPFRGHIGIIQRNAITSWTKLQPRPEIILFGTEDGAAECAADLGLVHIPEVARNQHGTPLLADIFARGEERATHDTLAYVNADIILPSAFASGVEKTRQAFPTFLAVGRRTNLNVCELIEFSNGWEAELKERTLREGRLESYTGIDFFVFPRGTYRDVPPLAIGRVWFDQWCIKYARQQGLPVIDLTPFVPIVHQLHDYNHVAGGKPWVYGGAEADENLVFYGEKPHTYTILNATHELTPSGQLRRLFFRRQAVALREIFWKILVEKTFSLRKRLGLSRRA